MCGNDKLVSNLVMDTLHQMVTDRDREMGYLKGLLRKFLYHKDSYEDTGNSQHYQEMKKAEKNLTKYLASEAFL